jgi:phosphopantothenoylcysteine synthetase/decarboxylase
MTDQPVVYVIACAAPPARHIGTLVDLVRERGWTACVLSTPSARRFLDIPDLEARTGYPVRSDYKEPGTPDVLPPPDAIIVAPITVNTLNKWAAGICDTLPLGLLVEAIGLKLPTVALPFTNRAHAAHPAFVENVAKLRSWGVTVLFGPEVYELHEPGTGSQFLDRYPWHLTVEEIEAKLG